VVKLTAISDGPITGRHSSSLLNPIIIDREEEWTAIDTTRDTNI